MKLNNKMRFALVVFVILVVGAILTAKDAPAHNCYQNPIDVIGSEPTCRTVPVAVPGGTQWVVVCD